ncbi:MAG: hypothetical protein R2706_07125 [Acidimicrobiales bacterium]
MSFGLAGSHNVSNALRRSEVAVLLGLTPAQAAADRVEARPLSLADGVRAVGRRFLGCC